MLCSVYDLFQVFNTPENEKDDGSLTLVCNSINIRKKIFLILGGYIVEVTYIKAKWNE